MRSDATPASCAGLTGAFLTRVSRRGWIAGSKPGNDAEREARAWVRSAKQSSFLFRTRLGRLSASRFSVGQDLFCINESLTLDSAKKTDSNRCDSEAVGVLPRS